MIVDCDVDLAVGQRSQFVSDFLQHAIDCLMAAGSNLVDFIGAIGRQVAPPALNGNGCLRDGYIIHYGRLAASGIIFGGNCAFWRKNVISK